MNTLCDRVLPGTKPAHTDGPPSAHQQNGIGMAFRRRADKDPLLESLLGL